MDYPTRDLRNAYEMPGAPPHTQLTDRVVGDSPPPPCSLACRGIHDNSAANTDNALEIGRQLFPLNEKIRELGCRRTYGAWTASSAEPGDPVDVLKLSKVFLKEPWQNEYSLDCDRITGPRDFIRSPFARILQTQTYRPVQPRLSLSVRAYRETDDGVTVTVDTYQSHWPPGERHNSGGHAEGSA